MWSAPYTIWRSPPSPTSTSRDLGEVIVDAFFDRFGGHTPTELLDELDLSREDIVADLVRIAPSAVDALRESGDLERMLRAELEPFYTSPEVICPAVLTRQAGSGLSVTGSCS